MTSHRKSRPPRPWRRAALAAGLAGGTAIAVIAGAVALPGAAAAGAVAAATSSGTSTGTSTVTATSTSPAATSPAPTSPSPTTPPPTSPPPTTPAGPPAARAANARIARLLPGRSRAKALGRLVGVQVVDVASGATVWSARQSKAFLPASNNKIVTAVTALQVMGPQRRIGTYVALAPAARPTPTPSPTTPSPTTTTPSPTTTSPAPTTTSPAPTTTSPAPTTPAPTTTAPKPTPRPIVWRTVHLVAGGDPLLTSGDLRALATTTAAALRKRGVTGARVRLDDTVFPAPTSAPGWTGGYLPYVVRPVRALVRDGDVDWDVAANAAAYFSSRLAAAGLKVKYIGRQKSPAGSTTIASTRGHTVAAMVRAMMLPSDNQIAEMLFRLSAIASGRPATWAGGAATARAVLTALKVPLAGVVVADGSGVSRYDRQTPRSLTTLLLRVVDTARYPKLASLYYGRNMPIAGSTGTLANRYHVKPSSCARGIVLAKTGTLHDVVALSGVTVGADKRLKVFAVLVNGVPYSADKTLVRRAVDNLAATVTGCW